MSTYIINRAASIAEGLGGGVAAVIACSKREDLDNYEKGQSAPSITSGAFHYGCWFRLYSDGFIEQGIITRDYWNVNSDDDNAAIQFPIPFKDTNYTVSLATSDSKYPTGYHRKTKYSIIAELAGDSGFDTANTTELYVTARGFVSPETIDNILAGKVWAAGLYDGTSPFHVWIDDPNA